MADDNFSMPAKFDGWCAECSKTVTEGERIKASDEGNWIHVTCPVDRELTQPVCSRCYQREALSGSCGCDTE